MLKYIAILCIIFLSVGQSHGQAADGYKFLGNPPILRNEFQTIVVEHNSRKELAEASREFGLIHTDVHAFSTFDKEKNTCTIHIIKPSLNYMPEHIGHELVHCFYGRWHK